MLTRFKIIPASIDHFKVPPLYVEVSRMVAPGTRRKMLAAREDLADKMSAIAATRGLYTL